VAPGRWAQRQSARDRADAVLASRTAGLRFHRSASVHRRGRAPRCRTVAGRASAGYSASAAHRGRGVASSALKALTTFAWTIPALYRVELYIEPWNNSSIHVAEASGYQREGLLRSYQEIGGSRRDMLLYAATRALPS
jgi:RimJ/RimL family protein N-acetyltransferase